MLRNELGSVTLTAELSEDVIAGTVMAPGIWWAKFSPDGRNINQVTAQDEADMGAGACFYDAKVWVEPATRSRERSTNKFRVPRSPLLAYITFPGRIAVRLSRPGIPSI